MKKTQSAGFLNRKSPPNIVTLILLAGLSALSMNIFLPSLPSMTKYFETDYHIMQLSVAVYLGVNAVFQIFVGPISDKLGRRPVILTGLALFLLATLGCIYAPSVEIFLVFRMSQSVIVVGMVLSRAVVRDMVPEDKAASMIGYVTMGMSVVPMLGPAIGGVLDGAFGWQANFWLLLVLGALTFALCWADLGETVRKSGLTLGQQFREYPELLMSPRFWGYSLATAFSSGSFFAYLGGAPYVGTEVFHLSTAELGFYFSTPALGYVLGNFLTGRFSTRYGINRMVLAGCIVNALGLLVSLTIFLLGFGSAVTFFGLMTFVGLGNGLTIPNATSGALSVRPHLAGTAAGLSGAIMIGGGAALSALAGIVLVPGTGADPLIWMMLITALLGLASSLYVIFRQAQISP